MDTDTIPMFSVDLIEQLEQIFPPISSREIIAHHKDPTALTVRAAQRSLVESLRDRLAAQQSDKD